MVNRVFNRVVITRDDKLAELDVMEEHRNISEKLNKETVSNCVCNINQKDHTTT